jgi:hypothetical protein
MGAPLHPISETSDVSMPLSRHALPAALLAIAGATLTGCGGDDPATTEGAEDTVRDYLAAFEDRDYDEVCDYWTDDNLERSIDEWNDDFGGDEPVDSCEDMLRQGVVLVEAFGEDLDLSIDSISSEDTGDNTAEVNVVYKAEDQDNGNFQMVYEDGEWLVDDETDEGEDDAEPTDASEEASEPPAEPSAIGAPATLGSWTITVTDVDEDAGQEIEKANEFNDPAQRQYLMVTFTATYNGTERTADASFDLSWTLTGTDSVVLEPASVVTAYENRSEPTEVRPGGTVEWQVPFDADPALVTGGLLTVESWTGESDEYVDFQL